MVLAVGLEKPAGPPGTCQQAPTTLGESHGEPLQESEEKVSECQDQGLSPQWQLLSPEVIRQMGNTPKKLRALRTFQR